MRTSNSLPLPGRFSLHRKIDSPRKTWHESFLTRLLPGLCAAVLLVPAASQAETLYIGNHDANANAVHGYNAFTGGAPTFTIASPGGGPEALLISGDYLFVA